MTVRSDSAWIDGNRANFMTGRELEILGLLGKGLSVKGVAQILGITPGTTRWHLKNLYQKLGAGSREEALRKARDENFIEPIFGCEWCRCAGSRPPSYPDRIRHGREQGLARFPGRSAVDVRAGSES